MARYTVLDLFSGPGGLAEGIKHSRYGKDDFDIIVANDFSAAVQKTYTKNHTGVDFVSGSIASEDVKKDIMYRIAKTGRVTVDVVIGGPPCQGYSLANKRTRNMDNPVNHLIDHYIEMVSRVNAKAFIIENVPGLFSMDHGTVLSMAIAELKRLGYRNTTAWLLNAADYGVPQIRKRAFIVGSRLDVAIEKPEITHKEHLGVGSVLDPMSGMPRLNHVWTKSKPNVIERMKYVPQGKNWRAIPKKVLQAGGHYKNLDKTHSSIYRRLDMSKPSITITNFRKGMIIHPIYNRLLSVREAARIQTFPDHYEFVGNMNEQQQQVSDAVPVKLALTVGNAVLKHLEIKKEV